jgi:hypothetical protein
MFAASHFKKRGLMTKNIRSQYVVIFLVSLVCVILELFFTRILNLKAWNHVVYTVIPFAMLGYGIGANIVLVFNDYFKKFKEESVLSCVLILVAVTSLSTAFLLKDIPIKVDYIVSIFVSAKAILMLLLAYSVFMVPFILIGFTIVYLFANNPKDSHTLYFFDLIGAGLGAYLFFPFINHFAVFQSLGFFSVVCLLTAMWVLRPRLKWVPVIAGLLLCLVSFGVFKEPSEYVVDSKKGWEWIPGYFKPADYEHVVSRWHALGRTDVFRMIGDESGGKIYQSNPGTFEINLKPLPEISYFSTNFLAGTPAYNLSKEGLAKKNSQVQKFSQRMEVPYLILNKPKVVVIGTGGGRDIFMAHTHEASDIVGAEINPGIVAEMSPGGKMYDYTGRIYTSENTKVYNIDGRHLIKKLPSASRDLIILNGVDTFSGLSSGAYAYAESYLYTKNAFEDYLRVLNDGGMINLYRWAFPSMPREELRLHAIALSALRSMGAKNPEDHIIIGLHGWSLFLIKKTPFTNYERAVIYDYLAKRDVAVVYPAPEQLKKAGGALRAFDLYTDFFKKGAERSFERYYTYDISVISDDNPFFYKYYRLNSFNPFQTSVAHHTGTVIFLTQSLILVQAVLFIALFIFIPLWVKKKRDLLQMPKASIAPFILYFACLGAGFMFIEIPLMQRFVLLLGSPIYSLSVILAVLLVATGVGSLLVPHLDRMKKSGGENPLAYVTLALVFYLLILMVAGTRIYDFFMAFSFFARILLVTGIIFPVGLLLGVFFPWGLRAIGGHKETIAWAWGINCGFSVLGSILSIIIAQFQGFNIVISLACGLYLIAFFAFKNLLKHISSDAD